MLLPKSFISFIPLLLLLICGNNPLHAQVRVQADHAMRDEGIRFSCPATQLDTIEPEMDAYLASLEITPDMVVKKLDKPKGRLVYTLNTPKGDTSTLDFKDRPELHIQDDSVLLPALHGKRRSIQTVSKKEIVLALLQHGRLTEFHNGACDVSALTEHVAIRQNIVSWAEDLSWDWTDGGYARWNEKYWNRGTPLVNVSLHEALNDIFMHQAKYSIGCYTATKIVLIQGVLDYYRRIKKDPALLRLVEERLSLDHDPLVDVEPGKMWAFEKDFDPDEFNRPGKIVKIVYGIAAKNFVPGDWIYILNTDPVSSQKVGYEGSNAIYLGRDKFDDYYNDHDHAYTYQQKLDEVYQWRNGVFSRSRDAAKRVPLTDADIERLSQPPAAGGLLTDIRVYPFYFGYEQFPAWVP